MASEVFEAQVALLVRVLPYVATEAFHPSHTLSTGMVRSI